MALVADRPVRVEAVLVLGLLGQRLVDARVGRVPDLPEADLRHLLDKAPLEKFLAPLEAELGLLPVHGGGIDLRARLLVHEEHIEREAGGHHGLAVLTRDEDVRIAEAPPPGGGVLPAEDVDEGEDLPVLQPEVLTGKQALEVPERLHEPAELGRGLRVQVDVITLEVTLPPQAHQADELAAGALPG